MWLLVVKFVSLILLTKTASSLNAPCTSTWFDCGNGKCIADMWVCDGDNDCGNNKDETGCESPTQVEKCLSSQFQCESGDHCIPEKWHCDGENDCVDGSDEKRCDNTTEDCTGFTCRNHQCIPSKWYCDGNKDCTDGSDEELCSPGKLCSDFEFLCSSGSCVNQTLVCDGKKDCADGTDEGSHCGDPCENATCSQKCKSTPSGPECFCNDGYVLDVKDNKTCSDIDECLKEGFCSHQCTNTPGGYRCSCQNGYSLVNGTFCQATGAEPLLIFATVQEIRGYRLRSNKYFPVRKAISRASAVDVDPKSERIYWIEISNRSSIYTAKLDGSDSRQILSHGLQVPEDIAVDYTANNLYLTDAGLRQVLVCKMDGTMCHVLHDKNVERPRSIVLDPTEGFLYWSDWGEHTAGIYRSGMDGSRRIPFVSSRIAWPNGIAIDHTTNRLYWADAKLNTIEYISLDGSSRKAILNTTVFHPFSLAVFEDTIYWTDWSTYSLESCNKFTGHRMTLMVRENRGHIMGVHVYHPVLMPSAWNPCWSSDCSHMCLISPGSGFLCACPHGFQLGKDNKTCEMTEYSAAVFVSEGSSVYYIRPETVGSETIIELPLPLPAMVSKVAFDRNLHCLFVADLASPAILAVNMTSLDYRVLVVKDIVSPEDLSLDWKSNNLYWIDSSLGTVEVISVDSFKRVVLLENLMAPVALAISPSSGQMFIATLASRPAVSMYDMDGKNKRLLRSVEGVPLSIALHPTKALLYWADPTAGTISFVNYTSSRSSRIMKSKIDGVMSIAASEDTVYWTSRYREVSFMKGNVTFSLELPGRERGAVTRKVTYSSGSTAAAKSECLIGNGGCSYICLTSPNGRTCACQPELLLAEDGVSCVARPCKEDFKCVNGQCLPQDLRCDGNKNCDDGSDEVGCNRCSGSDFQCKNGGCILKSWQCDKRNDCGDNSDEENCPTTTNCTSDQIACMNGECVSMFWRCDGEKDCEDGTDEVNCNVTRCDLKSHYRCDNGQCIPISWVCDNTKDCFDSSDEKNCTKKPKECTAHEFRCEADGSCIDELMRCDGRSDCHDGSDEKDCHDPPRNCKRGMYRCNDGACIYDYEVCDGHKDCRDDEDELNCNTTSCQPEEMLCTAPKRCILQRWICDGDPDCDDGRDEQNCIEEKSEPKQARVLLDPDCREFYCYSTHQCLPWSKVCDGRQDCEDLPDEGGLCSRACSGNGGCSHTCMKTPHGSQCSCLEGYSLLPDNKTCEDINECLELGTCSHFCNNTKGSFKCGCAEGYTLHDRQCKANGGPATMVYLLGDQIRGYNLVDHSQKVFVNVKDADMKGMDYDASRQIFFWTETIDGSINSYSQRNKRKDVILQSKARPVNIRYDWIARNLYYRDESNSIVVCTVDAKYCRTLIQPSTLNIDSMDISPTNGFMFWTIWANRHRGHYTGQIERAEMDGSHRMIMISDKIVSPTAITIDHMLKMIYWSDQTLYTLESADFYGFVRRQIVQSKKYHPLAVAVFEDYIFWADWVSESIIRCDKFKTENCTKIVDGRIVKSHILMIVHDVMQPNGNKCLNSNCSRMCLPTRSSHVCVCDQADAAMCNRDVSNGNFAQENVAMYDKCPGGFCPNGSKCHLENGVYKCNCDPPYSGRTCEVVINVAESGHKDYRWITAVVFAIVVIGIIALGILLCIRNREKLHRVSETVSVKFRSPKCGQDGRLVLDTDDGSLCEELALGQEGEYKQAHGNSDYSLADSEESDLKKWPPNGRDSAYNSNIANFFRKLKLNASAL